MKLIMKFSAFAVAMLVSALAGATVVEHANVGGLKTFRDTSTGRIWLDMDNFFDAAAINGTTGLQMISTAQAAGFIFANRDDVEQLVSTLPLGGGQWETYAAVMGFGIPRRLIWGMYDDDGSSPYGWAFAYSTDRDWGFQNNITDAATVQNEGDAGSVDMGLFAYQEASLVPEPASLALFGLGLAGLLSAQRRRNG